MEIVVNFATSFYQSQTFPREIAYIWGQIPLMKINEMRRDRLL